MKDIGSIFPLYGKELGQGNGIEVPVVENGRVLYSLCREALYDIAERHSDERKVALLPAYTCMTVADPFLEQGWSCGYYGIDRRLRIDGTHLKKSYEEFDPSLVVAHPYYGMDFSSEEISLLKELKRKGCIIVVDLTQCVFSTQRLPFVDYYVGSLRKWMQIPDGGFLETAPSELSYFEKDRACFDEFVRKQTDSMYLRGVYFENGSQEIKEISRRMNKEAVGITHNGIRPHRMAPLSYALMQQEDFEANEQCRKQNFKVLFDSLKGNASYMPVCKDLHEVTTAPLYFTIYVEKRSELQKALVAEHVYAPVIWPLGTEQMLVSDDVRFIYQHCLSIPCDQRYGVGDMEKVIKIINHTLK